MNPLTPVEETPKFAYVLGPHGMPVKVRLPTLADKITQWHRAGLDNEVIRKMAEEYLRTKAKKP